MREIKEGEYFIRGAPIGYPFDVFRRVGGQDHLINSFKTEIHARYFAAAQNIAAGQAAE